MTTEENALKAIAIRGVLVERYSRTLQALAQKEISKLQTKLRRIINEEFGNSGARAPRRLERRVNAAIDDAYANIAALILTDLGQFARDSQEFNEETLRRLLRNVAANVAAGETAFDITNRPILGRTAQKWVEDARDGLKGRFTPALATGALEGATAAIAISEILRGNSGIPGARRGISGAIRSLITGVEAYNVEDTARRNDDIVIALECITVHDSRRTILCTSLDGKWRAVSRSQPLPSQVPESKRLTSVLPGRPYAKPPFHFGCRTVLGYVTVLRESLEETIGPPDRAARGASGPRTISGDILGEEFWKDQPDEWLFGTQLGKSRTKLFRAGMSTGEMVDEVGNTLTLDELRAKSPEIFERAGI